MSRRTIASILWTVLILVVCWTPRRQLPLSESAPSFFRTLQVDKLIHATIFAGFAFLWLRAAGPRSWLVVACSGVALAIITELGQELPAVGRDGSLADGLADVVGVALGLILAVRMGRPGRASTGG